MSEDNRDLESGEAGFDPVPSVGSQLKAAREARQMSVGDIAMALKLGSRQVEALESGNWQALPGQTFIRGFVRNYARLLQVDPAPLMGQLDAVLVSPQQNLALPEQKRPVAMPRAGRGRRRDYAMVWSGLALVGVAAAIYFLWPVDFSGLRSQVDSVVALISSKEAAPGPAAPSGAPSNSQAEPVFPPGTTPQQVMTPQAVNPPEAAAPSAPATASSTPPAPALVPPPVLQEEAPRKPPAPAQQPPAPAADKGGALQFSFERDSWVEVRDRQGKVLFSQLSRAGTEQTVEGQGPFSLVIGNAPGVKLSLHGKPVDLASHTQGNVARLTLE